MRETFRLITASDVHIRKTKPEHRIDNYQLAQKRKISHALSCCRRYDVDFFGVAGDVFEDAFVPYEITRMYIALFNRLLPEECVFGAVFGQHDLRHHSLKQMNNTPLATLLAGTRGINLSKQPSGYYMWNDRIRITGVSWREDIPKPDPNAFNILFIHTMVIKDEKLWAQQKDYVTALKLLESTGYDLIISGDNHASFYVESGERLLVNNGSIMRAAIDQFNHEPKVSLIEVNENGTIGFDWITLPHKPSEKVFKLSLLHEIDKVAQEEDKVNDVLDFLDELSDTELESPNFLDNLTRSLAHTDDQGIKRWIETIIEIYSKEATA